MPGAVAPARLVCTKCAETHTSRPQVQPNTLRHPLRDGFRLIRDLPGVRAFLAVEPQEVVLCQTESADRRLKIYAAMRPVPIVFV